MSHERDQGCVLQLNMPTGYYHTWKSPTLYNSSRVAQSAFCAWHATRDSGPPRPPSLALQLTLLPTNAAAAREQSSPRHQSWELPTRTQIVYTQPCSCFPPQPRLPHTAIRWSPVALPGGIQTDWVHHQIPSDSNGAAAQCCPPVGEPAVGMGGWGRRTGCRHLTEVPTAGSATHLPATVAHVCTPADVSQSQTRCGH